MIKNGPPEKHIYAAGNEYQLARGFTARLTKREVQLTGGTHKIRVPVTNGDFSEAVHIAERECGSRIVLCTKSPIKGKIITARPSMTDELVLPNTGLLFSAPDSSISEEYLGEHLIERIDFIRYLMKAILHGRADHAANTPALDAVYDLQKLIRAGKIDSVELTATISKLKAAGLDIQPTIYLTTIRDLTEDVRHALFRAGYHLRNIANQICVMNQSESARNFPGAPKSGPCERESSGSAYDVISYESTDVVTAAYTSLDYLYRLLVFVMRRPAGDPQRPSGLHFPDLQPTNVLKHTGALRVSDLPAMDAPFAIPNLTAKQFGSLRKSRNDLSHNFGQDETRPLLYIGIQRPPKQPLQYVQYTLRDIAPDGTAETHPWYERFYVKQRDAQDSAHDYLKSCWNCAIDTVEWLITRLLDECQTNGIAEDKQPSEGFYYL